MEELAELDKKINETEANLVFLQGKYNETLAKFLDVKDKTPIRVHELLSKSYNKGKEFTPVIIT